MNKNALILISLGAAAFLTALFFIYSSKMDKAQTETAQQNTEQTALTDPIAQALEGKVEPSNGSGVHENEIVYKINVGEASYTANKQFLGKDAENIVGKTDDVQGNGYWNKDTNEVDASIVVNIGNLATGTSQRDSDVQSLITEKLASFRIAPTKIDVQMGQSFEQDIVGTMIINGQSKEVSFKTKGIVTDTTFSLEGTSSIRLSDFGITAPSLAGVFTVADELPISFKISGEAVTTDTIAE